MKKLLIYWLPILLWAGLIFYASSQPYEQQDLRPTIADSLDLELVEEVFSPIHFHYAGDEISVEEMGPARFVEFLLRKTAHFFAYFVLGFLFYRALKEQLSKFKNVSLSFIVTTAYAIFDEFHQSFTAGRTPHVEDVMIDAVGGIFGISLAILIYRRTK